MKPFYKIGGIYYRLSDIISVMPITKAQGQDVWMFCFRLRGDVTTLEVIMHSVWAIEAEHAKLLEVLNTCEANT